MTSTAQPRTTFDWAIYADATFAGLSVLIPIPLLDWASEEFFRRRMPGAIAKKNQRWLHNTVASEINQDGRSMVTSCLLLPFKAAYKLIIRLSRKLLYFLTMKEAAEKLSFYWHRAFLLDYAMRAGHLETPIAAQTARRAFAQVMQTTSSPLLQMARQVINSIAHITVSLLRARRGNEDDVIRAVRVYLHDRWNEFDGYFRELAQRYDRAYQQQAASWQ